MPEPTQNVEGWLRAAHGGCGQALGQALEACRGYLFGIADRELASDRRAKGGASDLVQQTFLEAQRDFATFHGDSADELRAWLRQLLLNNLANFTRDYRATAKRPISHEVDLDPGNTSDPCRPGLADDTLSSSGQAMAPEQAEAMQRGLGRLSEEHRLVIRLRHQEDLSFEEIGRRLGRTANAARLLWLRAVERLQEELGGPP